MIQPIFIYSAIAHNLQLLGYPIVIDKIIKITDINIKEAIRLKTAPEVGILTVCVEECLFGNDKFVRLIEIGVPMDEYILPQAI